ncbi:Na+/H+ exchanger 1 [Actinidia rufa]|uniref:Na+/H+ exchanger 1 n=1 Tax=Actinidia rufa TaxID=165716 RepID=A0A7J0GTJ8_9ERIC|nr:Na+/H+ exchanger 1 [Actinidia rufa]
MGVGLGYLLAKTDIISTSDHSSVVSINLFIVLLCTCIVIGHLLEENRWMNESITALAIGLCTGIVILLISGGKSSHLLVFSEDLFFIYLLPPIIFNAGFQVKKKQFFSQLHDYHAVRCYWHSDIFCYYILRCYELLQEHEYCNWSDLFSDRFCLHLADTSAVQFSFGEGVVNDATSVVLFNAIQRFDLSHINSSILLQFVGNFLYLFFASTVLGVVAGLLSAYVIKKLYFGRHSTDREVALMMLMAYLSYMLAELFYLSAILTVFFCGIVMSHYTWHNVTESSRVTAKHAFATLSFVCEIFIFLYVGMDAMDIEKWRFVSDSPGTSIRVSSILMGLVLVGRAAFVFPLSFLSNLTKKSPYERIGIKQQVTVWWAGLMRGAVSMALAYNKFTRAGHTKLRGNAIMITSTITVVLFSTVVFGLMTKPLCHFYPNGHDSEPDLASYSVPRPTSLRTLLSTPSHTVHYYWRKFDNAFMRPVFGGRGFVPFVAGSPIEQSVHQLQ